MDVLAIILPIGLIAIMIGLSYLLSENKKAVSWAVIGKGIALQLVFALKQKQEMHFSVNSAI